MRGVRQGFDIRQIYEPLIVATGNGPYYCLVTTHELFLGEIWNRGWADFVPCLGRNLASLFRGHSQSGPPSSLFEFCKEQICIMKWQSPSRIFLLASLAVPAFAGVTVNSPSNGGTVSSPVNYVASSTTSCAKGVASMGVYVDNQLQTVVNGNAMNTNVTISTGSHNKPQHQIGPFCQFEGWIEVPC